jgi:Lrp/AsnC family leucine-responsive transcriptional regulator
MNANNTLDHIDRRILTILQENGRITNVKLAAEVGLSPPTVLERVRKLEERGIIERYVALVDSDKVGKGLIAFVLVTLTFHRQKDIDHFRKEILAQHEVLECYHIAGEGDFLLKVIESNINAYRDFLVSKLTLMEGVQRVNTMIVFETLKRETKLSIEEKAPE